MSALYGTYARSNLAFERGEGVRLYAQDGTEYLDFHAGVAVNALGHGDPHMVAALKAAAEKVWHTANTFTIPEQERLGQRLVDNTFADAVFFTNSGTEAVECAVKTARHYFWAKGQPERYEIIAFTGSFHGRTMGMIAAAGNEHYIEGFGPPLEGFKHVAPGDLEAVKAAITPKTCAILIEPVQGEGGVTAMTPEFMRGLRKLCDERDMLLVLDEVQCGYGRTGKFFAYMHSGIEPDIMAVAKGIGAGFPLGACLAKGEVAKSMIPGTHGSTYGGNPLACVAALKTIELMERDNLCQRADQIGEITMSYFNRWKERFDTVGDVRGLGAMTAVEFIKGKGDTTPVPEIPPKVVYESYKRGVMLIRAGIYTNCVRTLAPLTISDEMLEEGLTVMEDAIEAVESSL
jgi:acetylornithine/N-succinyldiaminopimelate aminotransferase